MRLLRFFRPSHQHTAFSATLLMMTAIMLSRVIGYIREAYIAYAFGAGQQTDAYVAAFTLPDWLNYIVAGGTASITFISIYTRFMAEKRGEDAQKTFSIVITVMTTVLIAGTIVAEIFTPQFAGWMFHGFTPEQMQLCVHLTRILLPAQIFFYVGGVVSAVLLSHRLFLLPAFGPLIYNVFIIAGGVIGGRQMGIASLAFGGRANAILPTACATSARIGAWRSWQSAPWSGRRRSPVQWLRPMTGSWERPGARQNGCMKNGLPVPRQQSPIHCAPSPLWGPPYLKPVMMVCRWKRRSPNRRNGIGLNNWSRQAASSARRWPMSRWLMSDRDIIASGAMRRPCCGT